MLSKHLGKIFYACKQRLTENFGSNT